MVCESVSLLNQVCSGGGNSPGFESARRRSNRLGLQMLAAVFVITAAAAASAAPASGGTPTHTPSATLTSVQALWVENSLPGTITEFKGATLTTPGAFEPNAALTNHSANLFPRHRGRSVRHVQ
jgi:hypothetical protein